MFLKIQRIPKVLEYFIKSSSSSVNKECFNICDGQEFSASKLVSFMEIFHRKIEHATKNVCQRGKKKTLVRGSYCLRKRSEISLVSFPTN